MATGHWPPNANSDRDERDVGLQQEQPPVRPPRVTGQPYRGGYDCVFIQRPPSGLVQIDCPVCLLVLREPHQVTCCGYSYCQSCIEHIQNTGKRCPTCNKEFEAFPDKHLKRTLYAIKVYCCRHEVGCDWVGELLELDRHLNLQPTPEKLLVGCQFAEVDCMHCGQPFQRRYIQSHQSDDCPKRPHACQHCNKYAATFRATFEEVTQNHWLVCPFFPLSCPNNCDLELVLLRQEVEHHVSKACPLTILKCDFHMVGCQIELARQDMPSHISENLIGHMSLLQVHMMNHPGENMATYLRLMVGSIQKVVLDSANIHSELHGAQEEVAQLQMTVNSQSRRMDTHVMEIQEARERTAQLEVSGASQQEQVMKTHVELQQFHDQLKETCDKTLGELRETQETVARLEASGISQNENLRRAIDKSKEDNQVLQQQKDGLTERVTACEKNIQVMDTQVVEINDENKKLHHSFEVCSTQQERHRRNATAALDQHKEVSDENLRTTKVELSKKLAASEQRAQILLVVVCVCMFVSTCWLQNTQLTQQKHELTDSLSASEQQLQAKFNECRSEYRNLQQALAEQKKESEVKLMAIKEDLIHSITASEKKMQGTLAAQQVTITECRDENKRLQQNLIKQETESAAKLMTVKDDLTFMINASQCKIQEQEAMLNQHQKTLEKVTYTGTLPLEFTMTDFEQHKKASDEWYSPPFYTHTDGYKMCIKVYANGSGPGKGTHISVHGYLMRGNFDDNLLWPFEGAVTIQLLNQLEDDNHHTLIIDFSETTNLNVTSRVTSRDRAGSGWGFSKVISYTQLLNTNGNCQFLKENQLRFRVSRATNLDSTARIHRQCLALESFVKAIEQHVFIAPVDFTLLNFEEQMKLNDVWYSAFYTHPQGYKMGLEVYPNGYSDGLGTHVSIFTYIMQGPFDGSLKWPFRGDVTIQILNQAGEDNHHEEIIDYTDEIPDSIAGRVTIGRRSVRRGLSQFLSHSALDHSTALNTQYLQGDSLQIRISKVVMKY